MGQGFILEKYLLVSLRIFRSLIEGSLISTKDSSNEHKCSYSPTTFESTNVILISMYKNMQQNGTVRKLVINYSIFHGRIML